MMFKNHEDFFCKGFHLRCLTSFLIHLWSKTLRVLSSRYIKHFTVKKEGNFLVGLFFFFAFLYQLRKIQLWLSSTIQHVDVYWKPFRKKSAMDTIFSKVSVLQNGLSHGRLSISFPNTFLWLIPNNENKDIRLDDDESSKIFQRVVPFSYYVSLDKYLATRSIHSLYAQNFSLSLLILYILFTNDSYLLGVRIFFVITNWVAAGPDRNLDKTVRVSFPNRTWTQKNQNFP